MQEDLEEFFKEQSPEHIILFVGFLGAILKNISKTKPMSKDYADQLDDIGCTMMGMTMMSENPDVAGRGLNIIHVVSHAIEIASDMGVHINQIADTYKAISEQLVKGIPIQHVESIEEVGEVLRRVQQAMGSSVVGDEPLPPEVAEWLAIMGGKMGKD
jgi:hypothetical protein